MLIILIAGQREAWVFLICTNWINEDRSRHWPIGNLAVPISACKQHALTMQKLDVGIRRTTSRVLVQECYSKYSFNASLSDTLAVAYTSIPFPETYYPTDNLFMVSVFGIVLDTRETCCRIRETKYVLLTSSSLLYGISSNNQGSSWINHITHISGNISRSCSTWVLALFASDPSFPACAHTRHCELNCGLSHIGIFATEYVQAKIGKYSNLAYHGFYI